MGVALGDYDHSGPLQHLRHELRRGVQRALPQRRRPLHRRLVPLEDRGEQPALRRLGHRLLRLRQRRLARPDRGERPRLPAARQGAPRRVGGLPAAEARSTATAATARSTRSGRRYGRRSRKSASSRGLAVGDLDNDGRLDVVINDLDGSPQVLRNELPGRGQLADREAAGAGANTGRDRRGGHRTRGRASGTCGSCRAERATSRRTTCGCTSAWARGDGRRRSRCAGRTGRRRGSRT